MKFTKFMVAIAVLLMYCASGFVVASAADEVKFYNDPNKWIVDLEGSNRTQLLQLEVRNYESVERTYTASWWHYRYVDFLIEEDWVSVTPETLTLPPAGVGIFNIMLELPEDVAEEKFVGYIKLTDEVQSEERPITLVIRVGSAVPTHEYNIYPGIYHIDVQGGGDFFEAGFTVRVGNTGTADSTYEIFPRQPDAPDTIDPGYTTGSTSWVEVPNPTWDVLSMGRSWNSFNIVIPAGVPSGKYKVWVGVRDIGFGGPINIEYAVKVLIDIRRARSYTFLYWVGPLVLFGVLLLIRFSPRFIRYSKAKVSQWRRNRKASQE